MLLPRLRVFNHEGHEDPPRLPAAGMGGHREPPLIGKTFKRKNAEEQRNAENRIKPLRPLRLCVKHRLTAYATEAVYIMENENSVGVWVSIIIHTTSRNWPFLSLTRPCRAILSDVTVVPSMVTAA